MSAPTDRGGRAHDPEVIADVREQLETGSFRFTGENPANSENDYRVCVNVGPVRCDCGEGRLSDEDGCCVTCGGDLFDEDGNYIHSDSGAGS